MKGVNVKKIAALAGVALLAGAGIAAADVVYGSTQLVDQNGQPTVKIVVGSMAQVSDGVAAANIAAVIANNAYMTSTLSASVPNDACSVGGSTNATGEGTCAISNKKVTLSVSMPGAIAGAYQFNTLITDTIDKTLANRASTNSEDMYTSTNASDASTVISPLRFGLGDVSKAQLLYRIGGAQYSGFADSMQADPQATSEYAYTEEQNFWVGSSSNAIAYDEGSSYRDVVAKYTVAAYNARFLGNDYGIPVCTGGDRTAGDWTNCANDTNYLTANHRLKINFMGGEWVVSAMTRPTTALASSTAAINGGEIKLAKEAKHDIVNVGGVLDAGTFKVRLADISTATGSDNAHPAIIDVLDSNDVIVGQITVNAGSTYTFVQSGTDASVKIHVYKTAPGFTLNAKWAEIAVYTDEIVLRDGQRYNQVTTTDPNKNFKVSLIWKNRDYAAGDSSQSSTVADSLREIVIYNEQDFTGQKYAAGDSFNFLATDPAYSLTYSGLDLTDTDYEGISVTALSSTDYTVAYTGTDSCTTTGTYTAKLIEVSADGLSFGGSGDLLTISGSSYVVDRFYIDPIGLNGSDDGFLPVGTQNTSLNININATLPKILFRPANSDCYFYKNITTIQTVGAGTNGSQAISASSTVRYDNAGAESEAQGLLFLAKLNQTTPFFETNPSGYQFDLVLQEDAGELNTSSHYPVWIHLPFITNTSAGTFRFKTEDASTSQVYYDGVTAAQAAAFELPLVTERGSQVLDVSTSDAEMQIAKKVGMPTFTFAASDIVVSEGNTADYVLGEGDSETFGGVEVTVSKIEQTVGSCTASTSGGVACTVDTSKAVISPNNAAQVVATQPYTLTSNLVVTDREAPSTGVVIAVGGPLVNTVTADMLSGSTVDFQTDAVVVREIVPSSKIVVAGATAADTLTAAEQFIAGIRRQ
ncbi:S-layer protein [Candidatus Micrarchaeota archaeon]|nr:S-layer protein [Candidatus Micrarchaeota archaeon]